MFRAVLLRLGNLFVDAVTFPLGFFGGEGFAVVSHDAVDANAVDGEALGVGCGGLLQVAVAGEILLLDVDVVGVVLARGFGGLLVAFDVEEEFADWR